MRRRRRAHFSPRISAGDLPARRPQSEEARCGPTVLIAVFAGCSLRLRRPFLARRAADAVQKKARGSDGLAGANAPAPFGTAGAGAGSAVRTAGNRATSGRRPHWLRPWWQQSKPRPAGPTASTNVGSGGLPSRSFSSHGPLDGKGIMRSNNRAIFRGTESLL